MKIKKIVWRGELISTMEFVSIREDNGYIVKGHITGVADKIPIALEYILKIDLAWVIQSVFLYVETNETFEFSFHKNESGKWCNSSGHIMDTLEGCTDIDISLTPFTNTLPINRLRLETGMSREITVLYFDLPKKSFKPAVQRYTHLGNGFYKYEGLDTGFQSVIETDEAGLVINYPGIWQRIYP